MIVEKELKKVFHQLVHTDVAHISVDGFDVTIRVFDHSTKLALSTSVYFGGNFIPKSVRHCVTGKPPFDSGYIPTSLSIDEEKFEVDLNYEGAIHNLNNQSFIDLLEEFSWVAQEWRLHLDEHDKNDLVHVRVK
jgi:hypothetical protein